MCIHRLLKACGLLLLASCGEGGGGASNVDGGLGACRKRASVASASIYLTETGGLGNELEDFSRSFEVRRQRSITEGYGTGVYGVVLQGPTTLGTELQVDFVMLTGVGPRDQTGARLVVRSFRKDSETCFTAEVPPERMSASAETIRDANGKLLMLLVPSVPLALAGEVMLDPTLVPELFFAWEDLGCNTWTPEEALTIDQRQNRSVALRVAPTAGGGDSIQVPVGGEITMALDGTTYHFAMQQAYTSSPNSCGQAIFIVYRDDFFGPTH
jgi:hypothetical protein